MDAHRLAELSPTTEWLQQWVVCVMTNGAKGMSSDATQTLCAAGARPYLPSIPWFTSAELLLAVIGIVVAMVFIAKVEFWSEWSFLLLNVFQRGKVGNGSRGRRTPGEDPTLSSPAGNQMFLSGDELVRKGTRLGYNDSMPPMPLKAPISDGDVKSMSSTRNLNGGTQWYDMEDLLDKEYEVPLGQMNHQQQLQQQFGLQRNLSNGSRNDSPQLMSEPPGYQSPQPRNHTLEPLYGGNISQREAGIVNAWTPSAYTLSSPTRAYLVANDNNERFVEQPVVPMPVPRASIKPKNLQQQQPESLQQQPESLQSPSHSQQQQQRLEPQYLSAATSLSPMPQKFVNQATFSGSLPRQIFPDSVPIVSDVQGSPAFAFVQPAQSSSESKGQSGGSIGPGEARCIGVSTPTMPSVMPPSVPLKSPARQHSQNSYYLHQQSPIHLFRDQSPSTQSEVGH